MSNRLLTTFISIFTLKYLDVATQTDHSTQRNATNELACPRREEHRHPTLATSLKTACLPSTEHLLADLEESRPTARMSHGDLK
ncbi:MAG TPA: hypothetical protein DDX19_26310 [Rhodopirellula baltica]|uniref:Uncharacterized protein n=1 Tax=Rhodopirellula baltica (strain DSM 10527 / NCIMB 13988 / SH1) TaxID=243090 RepID=Q7UWV2_RHOBA|nr:hypothetical protein RB1771 [Rhodopirellula baltica SH 1]HBE66201.1 hypothetical protein [Rhodopirellula baltica]